MIKNNNLESKFEERAAVNEVRVLANTPADRALLAKALRNLLPPNFPRDEAEEEAGLREKLESEPSFSFLVIGTNLDDPDRAVVKGLSVGAYFTPSQTGALWYLVTDQNYRNQGLARTLIYDTAAALRGKATEKGQELKAMFAHIHNPDQPGAEDDPYDPRQRVAFYNKIGAVRANLSHFLSPYPDEPDRESARYLLIAIPQQPGQTPELSQRTIRMHTADYFRAYGLDPETHPDFQRMSTELDARRNQPTTLPLINYSAPSAAILSPDAIGA